MMQKNNYKYFRNGDCEYFPCHKDIDPENFNCLLCYCPLYSYKDCLGNPTYIKAATGRYIKVCSDCTYPHDRNNYDEIIDFITRKNKNISES